MRRRASWVDADRLDHIIATDRRIPDVHARDVRPTDPHDQPVAVPIADRGPDIDVAADFEANTPADGTADTQADTQADTHAADAQPDRHPRVTHGP